MKNIQQQIQANLDVGHHVIIQGTDDNSYRIISPYPDSSGDYRETRWYDSPDECKLFIAETMSHPLHLYNRTDYKYIGIYTPVYQTLKPGTKVRVRDDAKEWCDILSSNWHQDTQSLVGQVCTVHFQDESHYGVYLTDESDCYILPLQALEVITEGFEDQDTATVEYTMDEIAEKLGVDVKTIKIIE